MPYSRYLQLYYKDYYDKNKDRCIYNAKTYYEKNKKRVLERERLKRIELKKQRNEDGVGEKYILCPCGCLYKQRYRWHHINRSTKHKNYVMFELESEVHDIIRKSVS